VFSSWRVCGIVQRRRGVAFGTQRSCEFVRVLLPNKEVLALGGKIEFPKSCTFFDKTALILLILLNRPRCKWNKSCKSTFFVSKNRSKTLNVRSSQGSTEFKNNKYTNLITNIHQYICSVVNLEKFRKFCFEADVVCIVSIRTYHPY
jgi:hypothetical protein